MIKEVARAAARVGLPGLMNRRYLARQSAQEIETSLLPALVPTDGLAIDIGASRGLYVHHLLRLTSRVIAFEPLRPMQAWLRRVYGSRVDLKGVALSDRPGRAAIRYPRGNYSLATIAPTNRLEPTGGGLVIEECEVEMRTLDSYGISGADFIKIDVEGFEEGVLRGGMATLASRPALLIESEERHCAGAPARIRAMLAQMGYSGLFVDGTKARDMAEFDARRDQPIASLSPNGKRGRYINNFIFVPAERSERYRHALEARLRQRASQ